ncbi:MAG: ribonuclease [Oscillospiraceae bacterium]|nr:ribonuclease [Oscillospiraceae bacterium]
MKRKFISLLLSVSAAGLLCGCTQEEVDLFFDTVSVVDQALNSGTDAESKPESQTEAETEQKTEPPTEQKTEPPTEPETEPVTEPVTEAPTEPPTEAATQPPDSESDIIWGESYTTAEDVAEYIYLYGELPENFITKKEAGKMGWESSEGNLWEVAPGMSIGGDYFGNYEGLLPEGNYRECDINYDGGYRGAERIIYGDDGSVWYTDDHYESFTQLY